jgi:uncharacterized iron-regulated protein
MTDRPVALRLLAASQLLCLAQLGGCALPAGPGATVSKVPVRAMLERVLPTQLLLVGEQHDMPQHQALQQGLVAALAERGQLAALVLEMAAEGTTTAGLPNSATDIQVRQALQWSSDQENGWPWSVYRPVVMQAVRSGVPVLGGNLPRRAVHSAMSNVALDRTLSPQALDQQQSNIQQGHCGLLPARQLLPMARVQIARDQAMARTAASAIRPGQTVMLVAGNQHVRRDLGIPQHLDPGLVARVISAQALEGGALPPDQADQIWISPESPPRDYCADLEQQLKR